jgi:hypothetical protein
LERHLSSPAPSPEQRKAAGRLRGIARMKQIAVEDAAKRQHLVTELLEGLGRTPTAMDRVTIETLAAAHVRADRLRMAGRSDLEERRLIIQLQRAAGFKPAPPAVPKPISYSEKLAAQIAAQQTEPGEVVG